MFRPIPSFVAVVATTGLALGGGAAVAAASSDDASTGGLAVSSIMPRASAPSPAVGPQKTWTGKTAPVDLPGTGIEQGDRLPKGSVLVYRAIDVPKRQKRRVQLVVPKGKAIVTAAQSGAFGSGVVNDDYVGKRSVTIRVGGGTKGAEGRLYAYAR